MKLPYSVTRFLKYTLIGGSTFLFDLGLLYLLITYTTIPYLFSASFSFLIAVSINYLISRYFIFSETTRPLHTGYLFFLIIVISGLGILNISLYALVDILGFPFFAARVLISLSIGLWNYFLNLHLNFKVAGNHA